MPKQEKANWKKPALRYCDGLLIPKYVLKDENVRSAMDYKPRSDDLIVATYPKCGTTWAQYIIWEIFNKGAPLPDLREFLSLHSPFLEITGARQAEIIKRPAALKIHLPCQFVKHYSGEAKYIYVIRNPWDCCVSFYHHTRMSVSLFDYADGTFDDFFECFIRGEVVFGDYFDHLLSWYPHWKDPNLLFLTYENMLADPSATVKTVASFLGKQYIELIEKDNNLLKKIVEQTSFDFMKKNVSTKMLQQGVKEDGTPFSGEEIEFFRKGKMGGWKGIFSPDQSRRLWNRAADKLKGTDVMDMWQDV